MYRTSVRLLLASACVLVGILARAPDVSAQDGGTIVVQDVRRLGGSTAFYKTPLTNVASFKHMSDDPRVVANIRAVLDQGGVGGLGDRVVAAFTGATASVVGGRCADATPADGVIVECDVEPGQNLQWMAHRPRGTAPAILRNIRWAGAKPFRAYLFRVTDGNRNYTFVVPKVCGNVSLLHMVETPPAVVAAAVIPPPPPPPPAPVAPVLVESPPVAPEPISEQAATPPTASPVVRAMPFFVDAMFGKDRRSRPIEGALASDLEAAQCSPIAGLKVGVLKRFANNWEVGGAAGVAISLVTAEDKVKEHVFFIEAEANHYIGGGNVFVGGGMSLWDLSHSDTLTPAAMVHLGLPIAPAARFPVYFLVEGRVFLDSLDDVDNNYQFWGGIRVRF